MVDFRVRSGEKLLHGTQWSWRGLGDEQPSSPIYEIATASYATWPGRVRDIPTTLISQRRKRNSNSNVIHRSRPHTAHELRRCADETSKDKFEGSPTQVNSSEFWRRVASEDECCHRPSHETVHSYEADQPAKRLSKPCRASSSSDSRF